MRNILALLLTLWMSACTSTPTSPFHENLDRETGVTVSRMNEAMIFYDPETSAPPSANERADKQGHRLAWRDFLYLGPLEINRTGERRYYMWASLVRRERSEQAEAPSSIEIVADGQRIRLEALTQNRAALGAREPTYPLPAPWAAELYMAVSREQIEQIADATVLSARVHIPPGQVLVYKPMRNDHAAVRDFVKFVVEGQIW